MKKILLPLLAVLLVVLVVVLSTQSTLQSAVVEKGKDLSAPQKEVVQNIEGQEETLNVNLNEGKDSDYIIYVDEERYTMTEGEFSDVLTSVYPVPENFPDVSMEIKQLSEDKPEDYVHQLEKELKKDFPELRKIETVTKPVSGYLLHGAAGNEASSRIVHAYVISNGKKGSYVITGNYFLAAAEGHGARFYTMLESFEIVE